MFGDKSIGGQQDPSRVSLARADELRYWTLRFGCSEDRLRRAAETVGSSAQLIERYLQTSSRYSVGHRTHPDNPGFGA